MFVELFIQYYTFYFFTTVLYTSLAMYRFNALDYVALHLLFQLLLSLIFCFKVNLQLHNHITYLMFLILSFILLTKYRLPSHFTICKLLLTLLL